MNEYVMVLDFKDAKFFPYGENTMRVNPETLWYSHVCNALHVLFGHRPIPTFRKIVRPLEYAWVPEILDMAKNSKVYVQSPTETINKSEKVIPFTEIFAGTKPNGSNGGSGPGDKGTVKPIMIGGIEKTLTTCSLDWDRIKYYLESAWIDFESILKEVIGDYNNRSVYEVFSKLYDYMIDNSDFNRIIPNHRNLAWRNTTKQLAEYYQEHSKENMTILDKFFHQYFIDVPKKGYKIGTPIYEIIVNGNTTNQFFHQSGYGAMASSFVKFILHSPEQVTTISGKIFVKMSSEMLNQLKEHGKSGATILEGGVVTIEKIEDADYYNWNLNTMNAHQVQTEQ